jgi:N-acetylmuramoyl-L-alanine amidase
VKIVAHPSETNYTDLPADQKNLWFVDISNVWKQQAAQREVKPIRKILVHHHAGDPRDMTKKSPTMRTNPLGTATTGEGMPLGYIDIAGWDEYATRPLGYHYDIPYVGETSPDGKKLVVYLLSHPDRNTWHTGAGQNETGIGVSLIGFARGLAHPYGGTFKPAPVEFTQNQGLPSQNQRTVLPVLIRFLQETYNIADCHVQAHFQHGKPTCPGYDTERWVMDLEDRSRRRGEGFCYPVQLTSSPTGKPFLKAPDQERARFKSYLNNTRRGRVGFFPFGRRHFWHNGVHLYTAPEAPVHAVRDGWVVAARCEKKVIVDGADYGSANFVVIQHEDPGLFDRNEKRATDQSLANNQWINVVTHPTYFSLYMHLRPLDDTLGWVRALKEKDPKLYDEIQKDRSITASFDRKVDNQGVKKPTSVGDVVALPVKTGEIIGYVGSHDPFAALPKRKLTLAAPDVFNATNHSVLHFEMFSGYNLIERFDPNTQQFKKWTAKDGDANALAEIAASKLDQIEGLKDQFPKLKQQLADMEKKDPHYSDPSLWSTVIDDALFHVLSCVIVNHVSEWNADWKTVLNGWYREWGLTKKQEITADDTRIKESVEHHLKVVQAFQFPWTMPRFGWRLPAIEPRPYFYHPIRLLNWLNGMTRTLDVSLPYNTLSGVTPFDLAPRSLLLQAAASAGATTVLISKNTGSPAIQDAQQLVGTRVLFPPDQSAHRVQKIEAKASNLEVTIDPSLGQDVKKGGGIRVGGYGWHWEAKFAWDDPG